MLRIAVIGGGSHSRGNHLPALAHSASQTTGEIELAAFCDIDPLVAAAVSREFGFANAYTSVNAMLTTEALDGCIAITPIPITAKIAKEVIEAGIPLLMEKPPGRTPEEAGEICSLATRTNARVMVSMNRRFDPALCAAADWRADRPLAYVRATMHRHNRTESEFFTGTAIHALDAMRWIAGDIGNYSVQAQLVDEVWWFLVQLEFASGIRGMLEVLPSCGHHVESYEMFGPGYRLLASIGEHGSGEFSAWEQGVQVEYNEPAHGMPAWMRNGTYAETVEFLNALREGRSPHPTPAEVLQSVELCHQIQQKATG